MKISKTLLTAPLVLFVLMTFGQNKTTTVNTKTSKITETSVSNISEITNVKSQTLFISAHIENQSNSVLKIFNVNARRSGHVKIHDQDSRVVAVIDVKKGYNSIHFICPRGQYTLTSHDIDISDPKMTN